MLRSPRSRLWPVAGSCALLLLLGVSPCGLWERDEGRYADVAREMIARHDFVTPRIDGAVFLDKPPLVYWVTAASLAIWGPGETGARFGQLLFAAGILLVTRRIGVLLFERRRANLALLVLASCAGFFAASHVLTLDLGLTFCVSLTLLLFLRGCRAGSAGRRAYLGMFAAAAGGVLAKGPIGAVLPVLTIASFLTLRREWRRVRELPWATGVPLFLLIVAPWFIAVSIANPEFPSYFFVHEHLERFSTTVHRHGGAWYYYLAVAAAGLLPWSLFIPLSLLRGLRSANGFAATLRQEAPAFLWSWVIPGLVFFSASQSKLPLYVLPLFPAAALLFAGSLDGTPPRSEWPAALVLGPPALLILLSAGGLWIRHGGRGPTARAGFVLPLCLLVAGLALGGIVLGSFLLRRGRRAAGLVVAVFVWMAASAAALTAVSRVNFFNPTKHFAAIVREEARAGEQVFAYQCYLRGLPFYLQQTVGLVSPHSDDIRLGRVYGHDPDTFLDETSFLHALSGDRRVFAVARREDLTALQKLAARPLVILARSDSYELVSNRLGPERERALASVLDATGFDFAAALARAARAVPGAVIDLVGVARVGGEPTCALRAWRGGSRFAIDISMTRPDQITVLPDDPAGAESGRADFLLRLAPPPGEMGEVPRLIRLAAGE